MAVTRCSRVYMCSSRVADPRARVGGGPSVLASPLSVKPSIVITRGPRAEHTSLVNTWRVSHPPGLCWEVIDWTAQNSNFALSLSLNHFKCVPITFQLTNLSCQDYCCCHQNLPPKIVILVFFACRIKLLGAIGTLASKNKITSVKKDFHSTDFLNYANFNQHFSNRGSIFCSGESILNSRRGSVINSSQISSGPDVYLNWILKPTTAASVCWQSRCAKVNVSSIGKLHSHTHTHWL